MVTEILVVLNDSRILKSSECINEFGLLEGMMILTDRFPNFTSTVWISENGFTALKDREETFRWIREDY